MSEILKTSMINLMYKRWLCYAKHSHLFRVLEQTGCTEFNIGCPISGPVPPWKEAK